MTSTSTILPVNNLVALSASIVAGYRAAVAALARITDDETFNKERNRLFWGSLPGSRVDGVRNAGDAEELLRRAVMQGTVHESFVAPTPYTDDNQHTVYCFNLPHQYHNKGHTTYVRIGALASAKPEMAKLYLANGSLGIDFDDENDCKTLKAQFPAIRDISCAAITVIMGPNGEFIKWYCGYPKKIYTINSIVELLDPSGEIDLSNIWVQLSLDYNMRSREREYRKRRASRQQPRQKRTNGAVPSRESVGLASVEAALQQANGTAELEAAYDSALPEAAVAEDTQLPVPGSVKDSEIVA